ncbi:hypothetical protein NKR23_g734 [Pleurostoma richardsiae]|uniref:Centromere protein H C-terminal domain-containing protein n=1 Tax=Pleurostoma richardsiae TaxID=41990 RepID=A0AA38SF58_9PEZI|nr:hypothetical protein NKR23_g734 [Pleurostoma richardsiae]
MTQDVDMADVDVAPADDLAGTVLLSADEEHVLELYDKLQELQLQVAMLRARQAYRPPHTTQATVEDVKEAQDQLLDARAAYVLRNSAVANVMAVNPILRAVHNSTHASPIERDLLPHVEERDSASVAVSKQSAELRGILDQLASTEAESLRFSRQNVELAAEVISLAQEANRAKEGDFDSPRAKQERESLERDLKRSRQKWKIIKGTASAIVAGSGVDWVRDPELREVVLDPE